MLEIDLLTIIDIVYFESIKDYIPPLLKYRLWELFRKE